MKRNTGDRRARNAQFEALRIGAPCPTPSKRSYYNHAEAKRNAKKFNRNLGSKNYTYKCQCGCYHLTSKEKF